MKTLVVCGLLGAGKTTFIQNFAGRTKGKIVVLVNDFGKAGIDGEIFSAGGIESIELPSGCVCCTLKFDLMTTLKKIVETLSPEYLLIEPSGIASPSGVLEALDMLGISPVTVVGIVDATEFTELYEENIYGKFFEDQVRNADIILVNKSDLADTARVAGTRGIIESLNPGAILFETVHADIRRPLPEVADGSRVKENTPHFAFDSISIRLGAAVDYMAFKSLFEDIARGAYGTVVRAKALVRTERGAYRFDLVYGKGEQVPFASDVAESRLVLIGENLRKDALQGVACDMGC